PARSRPREAAPHRRDAADGRRRRSVRAPDPGAGRPAGGHLQRCDRRGAHEPARRDRHRPPRRLVSAAAATTPPDGGPAALVPTVLAEYGDATRVALCEYLKPREPRRHLYTLVADYPRRGGRMLRPSLCIASVRAFGGRLED